MIRYVRLLLLLAVLVCGSALAQERILSFDSRIDIAADGSLDVTEIIAVRAEGSNIQRGIYRDFPTRYKDRNGQRFVVDFDVVSLQRNGAPEPYFTEKRSNGVRVNFGNDDFLPVPAEHVYTLRYRTTRQVGFFADHDELYWNVTGHGWDFPIERASARIVLPVATDGLRTDEYTGAVGSKASAASVIRSSDGATWTLERALAPGEGMTVVLGFPKGIVTPPTDAQRMRLLLRDLAGPIVIGLGLLLMLFTYIAVWLKIGRDPRQGTIIPQYDPPPGHTPAGLRYLRRQGCDGICFSADIVALAVSGVLRIEREEGGLLSKDDWTLQRLTDGQDAARLPAEKELARKLFTEKNDTLELKTENATRISAAQTAHNKALRAQYVPSHFRGNYAWSVLGIPYAFAAFVAAAVLSRGNDVAVLLAILGLVLMIATVVVFAFLLRQRTPAGRALLDRIEGLRLYLGVAEREELGRLAMPEPAIDADRYQALLPFALALDVEAAWTKRFTAAVGEAAVAEAARNAHWVSGNGFARNGFAGLGSTLASDFNSQISSAASPPGSSSGGGGGGFSGGGGGGGGGGGR